LNCKNDFLLDFKENLEKEKIPFYTAKNYIVELRKAFLGQEFNKVSEIDSIKIENYIQTIKNKKSANNLKIALQKFKELNNDFQYNEDVIDYESAIKSHKRTTKFKSPFNLSSTLHKINALENEKFKFGYKLLLNGALRVDELSKLTKENFNFDSDNFTLNLKYTKGNIPRNVEPIDTNYLKDTLPKFLKNFSEGEKIFYSASNFQKKANNLDFRCHDLRRASSQIVFKSNPDLNADEKIEKVKKHLGHTEKSTIYKKYLSRKIDFTGTKWEVKNVKQKK
jgi:integrase